MARTGRPTVPLEQRFWSNVLRGGACWLWTASVNHDGYGKAYTGGSHGKHVGAHLVAWQLADGAPIPYGMKVLHTCDIPACVRNDEPGVYIVNGVIRQRWGHLFLGTTVDNQADMVAKVEAFAVASTFD